MRLKHGAGNREFADEDAVDDVVQSWAEVIMRYGIKGVLLVFDSYYYSAATRKYLNSISPDVKYCASVQPTRINDVITILDTSMIDAQQVVKKPGDWYGVYKPATKESLVKVHDVAAGVKYNISNCLQKSTRPHKSNENKTIKGAYDIYKNCFSVCDNFNRALHDRKWPHKSTGGDDVAADQGQHDTFAFSCVMQNVINAYIDVNNINTATYDYKTMCVMLSDALYTYYSSEES